MTLDEIVRERLSYNPETGELVWTDKCRLSSVRGKAAGTKLSTGYVSLCIRIDGKQQKLLAHRVAWLLHYGEWPRLNVDHANGDRADNRISNLRLATRSQNQANRRKQVSSSAPYKGICYINDPKRRKRWQAQISFNGSRKSIGYFSTAEEAHEAYMDAARRVFGEFARAS